MTAIKLTLAGALLAAATLANAAQTVLKVSAIPDESPPSCSASSRRWASIWKKSWASRCSSCRCRTTPAWSPR